MKTLENNIVLMNVGEATLLFGIWREDIEKFKGKKIVVVNSKRNKTVAAFQFIEMPKVTELERVCPCCDGKGKVNILR